MSLGTGAASRRAWWAERGALVAATVVMAMGAATTTDAETGRVLFVVAGLVCAGLVGLAWKRGAVSTGEVLAVAVLLRLIAFPLLPGLSDDGFRYVWDGLLQAKGINPYLQRPADLGEAFEATLYPLLNSADYYSVYPPASQLVFFLGGVAASWGWPVGWYGIKAAFVGMEFGGVWALSRMVSARALLLYAWHPLVVIEVAGQAHTEAGMVGGLLLAVWAWRRRRPIVSVAALTVAGWFKLYPLALLPFLLRRTGWRYAWVAVVTSALLLLPYASPSVPAHIAESLDLYVRSFEFNAGPYFALKQLGYVLTEADQSKVLGPALRVVFLLCLAGLFLADGRRRWPVAWVWLAAVGLLWATATTVHPWYLLGILALLPLTLGEHASTVARFHAAAWLWLSVVAFGTYLFYTFGDIAYWPVVWIGWGGWAVLMGVAGGSAALPAIMRRRARSKWRWLRPYVGTPDRLLDLGAGEGYVGECAARDTGAEVTLADVVDFNRSTLPLVMYDGRRLPFEDASFDVTLLVFVLHHAEDPDAVLREARRITRRRVLVVESVYETPWEHRWLEAADRIANRLRSGGRMRAQEEHLGFRPAAAWAEAAREAGFVVEHEVQRGNGLHRQHLIVLAP